MLRSLITDGVIAGVGGVLIFLPQIALLVLLSGDLGRLRVHGAGRVPG